MSNIDVSESDNEVRVCADLPSLNEDDIDVSVDNGVLTIRAEKRLANANMKESFRFVKRSFRFLAILQLPFEVDSDKIRSDFHSGVLTVTLPKRENSETI